jgi:hypothetical protein
MDHRDKQIREQGEGNQTDDEIFHGLLEFFAPAGVEPACHKKERDDGEIDEVSHVGFDLRVLGSAAVPAAARSTIHDPESGI